MARRPRNASPSTAPRNADTARAGANASTSPIAAWAKPSTRAAAVNPSGMMKRRASTAAIAAMSAARPAPAIPRKSGARTRLAAALPAPAAANAAVSAVRMAAAARKTTARHRPGNCGDRVKFIHAPNGEINQFRGSAESTNLRRGRNLRRNNRDGAAQLGPQLLGDKMRVDGVANDLRADENDELGAGDPLVLMREGVAQPGNLVEQRDAAAVEVLLLLNQSGQQYGLAARDRNRALDLA